MAYDFITTTITSASFIGPVVLGSGVPYVTGQTYNSLTGLVQPSKTHAGISALISGSASTSITSSLGIGRLMYFVNGLLVSSSA